MLVAVLLFLLALAAPATGRPTHAETGVIIASSGGNFSADAAAAKATNAGWASQYVGWAELEPSDDAYDQTWIDQYHRRFQAIKQAGMKVNVTFINTPSWASGQANPHYPPTNPQSFGDFVAWFAREFGAEVDGYELGNEPNGGDFWLPGPEPARYAAFAQAAVNAVEAIDPTAVSFVGALAGADDEFMEEVLRAGLTGFDAVAYHSGTRCKVDPPGHYIREMGTADIHDNSSTGYRELAYMMRMFGIANPVLADTAAGWSTSLEPCDKPGAESAAGRLNGVSEKLQGEYIRDSLGCAEADPEVKYYFVFSLFDAGPSNATWDHRMGLLHADGRPKAGHEMVKEAFGGASPPVYGPGGWCGGYVDHTPPAVTLTTTAPGGVYVKTLQLTAKGTDEHPVAQVKVLADGKEISGTTKDGVKSFDPWFGAQDLSLGEHTITATARDEAGNVSEPVALKVRKVDPKGLPPIATKLTYKVKRGKGRRVTVSGRLTWPQTVVTPGGRIRLWFQKGRFISKYSVDADEPFRKTVKLKRRGKWRVRVFYAGGKPFKATRAKVRSVRVR